MEKGRMNGNGNCDYIYGEITPNGRSSQVSSPTNCIVHPVSKFDTLAGVAIKYGVEVADIKKMNGLITDLQMFALKSLRIPLPGRHPPSPCLLEGRNTPGRSSSEKTPSDRPSLDFFESFQSLKLQSSNQSISPAMSSLQDYYGLKQSDQKSRVGCFEMSAYRKGALHYLEDELVSGTSQDSDSLTDHHRTSKSSANGFLGEKGEVADLQSNEWNDKLIRRRQKSVNDFSQSPERLLKDDNGFPSSAGKGFLAQRPKSRTNLASDNEVGMIPIPVGLGDSFVAADGFVSVRKSSSTSNLPDEENSITSSIWGASMWSLKPDLQAISSASRPIFDGLPKPLLSMKEKHVEIGN